jgi:hypothetical protein
MIYDPYCTEVSLSTPSEPVIDSTVATAPSSKHIHSPSRGHETGQTVDAEIEHRSTDKGTPQINNETRDNKLTEEMKSCGIRLPVRDKCTLDDGVVPAAWDADEDCDTVLLKILRVVPHVLTIVFRRDRQSLSLPEVQFVFQLCSRA